MKQTNHTATTNRRRDGVADWSEIAEEEGESVCNLYRCYKVGDAFHAYEVQTIY